MSTTDIKMATATDIKMATVTDIAALLRTMPTPGASTIEVQQWLERKAELLQRIAGQRP